MRSTTSATSRVLYRAFIPAMAAFLSYVGAGYYLSIVTTLPGLNRSAVAVVCGAVAVGIFFLVRRSAFDFARASHEGGGARFVDPLLWFAALLAVSAYGFLSSSLLLFEGPQVARENIAGAVATLERLSSRAPALLRDANYDALAGRVRSNADQLTSEIQNVASGSFCGIGDRARATIARIKADLPPIDVINGTDRNHDCRDKAYIQGLQSAYANLIRNALANSPEAQRARPDERRALLARVDDVVKRDVARLRAVGAVVANLPSFIFNIRAYDDAVSALDEAAADYDELASRLSAFGDLDAAGLPRSIRDTSLARMSSGLQLVGTVATRLDRPSVLLLLALSILGDAFAIFITFRAIRHQGQLDIERRSALEALKLSRSGVEYLWRPRLHPLRRE